MKIDLEKFGKLLISRPAGKEAFAAAKAYILPSSCEKEIVLDFTGVDVLSPSWADEFISGLKGLYPNLKISYLNTDNQSVKATLDILKSDD
jgi:hypothetical protein